MFFFFFIYVCGVQFFLFRREELDFAILFACEYRVFFKYFFIILYDLAAFYYAYVIFSILFFMLPPSPLHPLFC